ncbi:hypothetical protein BS47DRAFT_1088582 [Hydnum rufescens UP504]|uniref:Aminoglycoside phosphotransferase domain-containing protein n=1 Tax=Hydnum rufescens UP504 TaxID=1448309 RepID=A0A9P6AUM3_9AGAM|nr:hypothetical protein BS47DRAFT_1088582 [Hydnum rufescens UP504]
MSLDRVIDSMNTEQLDHIATQIKTIRIAMRRVKLARTMYGAVDGGPFRNHYYPSFLFPKAAFSTAGEFLDHFRRILLLFCTNKFTEGLLSEFPRNAPTVFTHGDLVPPNIMVDGTTITGIIDWATAGFYPEYWEMARMRNPGYMTANWVYILDKMYPNERTREREINAVNRLVSVFAATF